MAASEPVCLVFLIAAIVLKFRAPAVLIDMNSAAAPVVATPEKSSVAPKNPKWSCAAVFRVRPVLPLIAVPGPAPLAVVSDPVPELIRIVGSAI
jgi:hypothetical protein